MRPYMTSFAVASLLAFAVPAQAVGEVRAQSGAVVPLDAQEAASRFWSGFRSAVGRDDRQGLLSMCADTVHVRGQTDMEPIMRAGGAARLNALLRALDSVPFGDAKSEPKSVRAKVMATPDLGVSAWVSPDQLRFQNLEFRKVGSQWRLATIFEED